MATHSLSDAEAAAELAADPPSRLKRLGELDRRLEDHIRREEFVLFRLIEQALPEAVLAALRAAVVQPERAI